MPVTVALCVAPLALRSIFMPAWAPKGKAIQARALMSFVALSVRVEISVVQSPELV